MIQFKENIDAFQYPRKKKLCSGSKMFAMTKLAGRKERVNSPVQF